jgi:hypothetical protein
MHYFGGREFMLRGDPCPVWASGVNVMQPLCFPRCSMIFPIGWWRCLWHRVLAEGAVLDSMVCVAHCSLCGEGCGAVLVGEVGGGEDFFIVGSQDMSSRESLCLLELAHLVLGDSGTLLSGSVWLRWRSCVGMDVLSFFVNDSISTNGVTSSSSFLCPSLIWTLCPLGFL